MSVPSEVTIETLRVELAAAAQYAAAVGVTMDSASLSPGNLTFSVAFKNSAGEDFFAEFDCRDYPLYPPNIEFTNADRSQRGLPHLYPQGFHPTPCICMRYSRKAYQERGGPHGDWRLIDWRLPTGSGIGIDSIALMVSDLDAKIRSSIGRMG